MDARLRSTKPRTALATPTPPTKRAVSPTRVRNCVNRSMFLAKRGSALRRARISPLEWGSRPAAAAQPAGAVAGPLHAGAARRVRPQDQALGPAHEAPRLHEPPRPQGALR